MSLLTERFEEALCTSYYRYTQHGARSNEKLRPLHGRFASTLEERLDGQRFQVQHLDSPEGEAKIEGRYFVKRVDIAVLKKEGEKPLVSISLGFIMSNFRQNSNNQTANL